MNETQTDSPPLAFDAPLRRAPDGLTLDIEGYEGPLDVLLLLARRQKVDLRQISILELAEQYLDFIRHAEGLRLEIAADYLVMAAWLAYLKSRLLLPSPPDDGEADPEEMAAHLVFRLQCLEAMREAATSLMARRQLGHDFHLRGAPEGIRVRRTSTYDATMFELLASYSTHRLRKHYADWKPPKLDVLSIERARRRLERLLPTLDDWSALDEKIGEALGVGVKRRTALASALSAVLELVRDGRVEIRQTGNFSPIHLRRARPKAAE